MAQVGRHGGTRLGMGGHAGLAQHRGALVAGALICGVVAVVLALGRPGGVVVARGARTAVAAATAGVETLEGDDGGASGAGAPAATSGPVELPPVLVHVDGAVQAPGVYEMAGAHPRVNDAVMAAGGLAPDADTAAVNLAAEVTDGEKVHVPREGEVPVAAPAGQGDEPTASGGGGGAAASGGLVNINTASADELVTLPGVGPATASAIIEDRTAHGRFASVEDLMRVSGIGEKKFAKLRGSICV